MSGKQWEPCWGHSGVVIKGSARAEPGELACHLLREDTNEAVRVLELSGLASLTLPGALAELDGVGAGGRVRRTLYHASINTPVEEQLTPEQQNIARRRLAEKLGLSNQPYAMVEHVKAERQHTHIVWGRIDVKTGKAIPDSHNYRKHEEVSRELEIDFGHNPVLGAHVRDKQTQPRPPRTPSWGELRQAERSGLTPQEAKQQVTALWQRTNTGTEFAVALSAEGWTLARGDRRDFVLVDRAGEVHGLTRRIEGVKAAQVRERMAAVDISVLPTLDQAQQRARQPQAPQAPAQTVAVASEQVAPVPESATPPRVEALPHRMPPSVQQPAPPEVPRRPSAVLFVQIFGILIDAYQRAVDRGRELLSGRKETLKAVQAERPERTKGDEPAPARSSQPQPVWTVPEDRRRLLDELREELEKPHGGLDHGFSL